MDLTDIVLALRAVDEGDLDRGDLSQLLSTLESWERGGLRASCAELLTREFRIDAQRVRRWESEIAGRPSRRVGKYLLRRRVGQGGMGVVFEAEHPNLSRPVALKILSPSQGRDPAAIQRFLREVKSAGRFNHPHIVHAYDAGIDGDVPYLVMEFVDGENLFQVLVRGGPIPFSSAIMWMRQATLALSVLEGKRWVHGDGKPSNWILAPGGILKLADLGLCGPPGKPRRDTHVRGTPPYIAPEQRRGRDPIDTRADLYSLGATFYHLLTGRPPHEARTVAE
ncbi:MAG: protein kinase, partial [Planctomycetota bacterium]